LFHWRHSQSISTYLVRLAGRLGWAPPHRHELALGSYSVHTSAEALRQAEEEIRRIGARLLAEGKKSYALREYGDAAASRSLPRPDR
jgi:hypothetical protein